MKRKSQAGLTLIELMIALLLGVLVAAAAGTIFLGGKRSFNSNTALSEINDGGRVLQLAIVPTIRQAGYLPDVVSVNTDPGAIFTMANQRYAVFATNNSASSLASKYTGFATSTVVANTDVLVVSYAGRAIAEGTQADANPPVLTCNGDAITSTQMSYNIFYIATDTSSRTASLWCTSVINDIGQSPTVGTSRTERLVVGVTDQQVLVDVESADGTTSRSYTPNAVPAWNRVVALDLRYQVVAQQRDRSTTGAGTFQTGERLSRTISSYIQIRNRISS